MNLKEALSNLSILMFGGKGGVGKTTCASSSAIWAADMGRNVLIISTDPAHSLGDSLGLELIQGELTPVPGVDKLTALEINPRADMKEVSTLIGGSPVDEMNLDGILGSLPIMDDIKDISSLSPPGIDEAMALMKLLEFIETEHEFDLIIFDTAPTGHTLRFLNLPETLSTWIGKLIKMRLKLGKFFGAFKRLFSGSDKEEDRSLEILEKLNEAILRAREDLTDPTKNSFIVVMIPEEMAITETGRLLNELIKYEIPADNIIVNQLYPEGANLCDFCRARQKMQERNLIKIESIFKEKMGKNIIKLPLFNDEIRGIENLRKLHQFLIK
ncbi:MAG: ArsA family ATPase [Promethearchaeota archaeon]